jgi:hypothetical protein
VFWKRKPRPIETALAFWVVDAATWRAFVRAVRTSAEQTGVPHNTHKLRDELPADGLEVVIREDSVHVGRERFEFIYLHMGVTLREGWLEFDASLGDGDSCIFPVPVPAQARSEAARIADYFTQRSAEQYRREKEERARPTLSNRLLNFVEGHFVLSMFIFFFVLLPAFVALICVVFPERK